MQHRKKISKISKLNSLLLVTQEMRGSLFGNMKYPKVHSLSITAANMFLSLAFKMVFKIFRGKKWEHMNSGPEP